MTTTQRQRAAKVALAATSLVLIASMGGGFLLLPLLVPGHVWAARTSRTTTARVLWSALPMITAGMVAWALVYVTVGERQPTIWLLPVVAAIATVVAGGVWAARWSR